PSSRASRTSSSRLRSRRPCDPCVCSPSTLAASGLLPSAAVATCHTPRPEANPAPTSHLCPRRYRLAPMGRGAEATRAYNEQTKHSPARLRSDPHTLDWANMPKPFKVYVDLEPIALPRDFVSSTWPALAAIGDAGREAGGLPLDRRALAHLLYFSAGVLRRRAYPGGEIFYRAAACTGALYHIDCYLVCAALPDLAAGVSPFGPHDFALRRLREGDHRRTLVAAAVDESAVRGAPAVVVYSSTFWRNAWKYRARTYRHCFWDSGTILANLLAVASGTGRAARVVQSFVDADVNRLLDLDTEREVALGLVALGGGATPAPAA